MEKKIFEESLSPLESPTDNDSEKLFIENPDEVRKYAAYTEYSSFRKFTAKSTPSLLFHPIQNIIHSGKQIRENSPISFFFQKQSIWVLSAAFGVIFSIFVSGFYQTVNSPNVVDKRIQLLESDCSFRFTGDRIWKIREQNKRCSVKFASAYGSTSVFLFPNTSLIFNAAGTDFSDLIVELEKGKFYLKETLSKQNGTKFQIASWTVQLTGTVILSEIQNTKVYFTLIEGSIESQYVALDSKIKIQKDILAPGDTIELEGNSPKSRKIHLETKHLDRLKQDLNHWNVMDQKQDDSSLSSFFNREKKMQNGNGWIVRLKDGRTFNGKIQSDSGKIVVFTQSGTMTFNEDEILSISK
ncbi:hypothetical protein JWG45_06850 [Leptospira sp. 201903070]|uniref:Iron dicitrate transport regulator FecR n=1 Tax=Leptospira ainlahdjerensis TaxID=2810033 RepID=A0ABS2U932_9LEPT|nr:hypothetical protein [Leptospira ainlahdjerensis]MBM9576870.1 hypothetical protein [Leptospira ainlahdjerensis]